MKERKKKKKKTTVLQLNSFQLTDPEKRKIYDNYGFNGPKSSQFSHFDYSQADDIFAKFFSTNQFDHD